MEETNDEFRRFDVVSDDSDHRFGCKDSVTGNYFSDTKSKVYKNIMKEWKILERNLPESIYVRVYERRIDLMRAVIVGAPGTPYHDGLFFCDIAFPHDYPTNPPKLYFHSSGSGLLNPNIYRDGKVCVSLLNTTSGKKEEMWDPSHSTLLQVLLSIQALLLTEKPLLNIFGSNALTRTLLDGWSRAYNESIFIDTCRISLFLIQKPPKNFEDLVTCHFRQRGLAILTACNEYANGRVRVGYYGCDTTTRSRSSSLRVKKASKNFRQGLESIYPDMYEAFLKCGASLGPSVEHLELQTKRSRSFKKAMAKIKQALGWMSKSSRN